MKRILCASTGAVANSSSVSYTLASSVLPEIIHDVLHLLEAPYWPTAGSGTRRYSPVPSTSLQRGLPLCTSRCYNVSGPQAVTRAVPRLDSFQRANWKRSCLEASHK